MNDIKENIVILNKDDYDLLQNRVRDTYSDLKKQEKLYDIFERRFWENLFECEDYDFRNIKEENIDDFHFRDLVCKAMQEGITDIEYITEKIIEYKNKSEVKEDE